MLFNSELFFWLPLLLFALLEEFYFDREQKIARTPRWLSNFMLLFINRYVLIFILPLSAAQIQINLNIGSLPFPSLLANSPLLSLLFYLFCFDLINYGMHRLYHVAPILWRFHQVHHSDLDVDVSTSIRHHPFEVIISGYVVIVLMLLLGASVELIVVSGLISHIFAIFVHSNIYVNSKLEKYLNYVVVTPRFHGIHHMNESHLANSNYGGIFSIWDRCFRSYQPTLEKPTAELRFGLFNQPEDQLQNLFTLLIKPFKKQDISTDG